MSKYSDICGFGIHLDGFQMTFFVFIGLDVLDKNNKQPKAIITLIEKILPVHFACHFMVKFTLGGNYYQK